MSPRQIRPLMLLMVVLTLVGTTWVLPAQAQMRNFKLIAAIQVSGATSNNETFSTEARPSLMTGFRYTFPVTDVLSVESGLSLSSRSFNEIINVNNASSSKIVVGTTLLEAPLMLVYTPYLSNSAYVGIGGYLAYRFNAKVTTTESNELISAAHAQTRNIDFGPMVKVGYELSERLYIELSGQYGLQGVFKAPDAGPAEIVKFRDYAVSLGLGYNF